MRVHIRGVAFIGHANREVVSDATARRRCPDGLPSAGPAARAFTHTETHPMAMLSVVASLTPFSDFNQSPAQHVPVPDGQADHGHARAGALLCIKLKVQGIRAAHCVGTSRRNTKSAKWQVKHARICASAALFCLLCMEL